MLELRAVSAWYGSAQALFDVSLCVDAGSTLALVGLNGAGKTTTIRAIAGLVGSSGEVLLDGTPVHNLPPYERVRAHGLSVVHEGRGLFAAMTVRENLLVGQGRGNRSRVDAVVDAFPQLASRLDSAAGDLSGGEQQMVALGRAVIAQPTVLLLDEPSSGLAPVVVERLYDSIATLFGGQATTILLVEQDLELAGRHAETMCLLRAGSVVATVSTQDQAAVGELVGGMLS
jgi:branched-chain amino acid transport system ATP-binding protein